MSREIRRSAIWSDPRVKPPFGSVEIDWGHPLSRGLASCFLLNEGGGAPIDLTRVAPAEFRFGGNYASGSAGLYAYFGGAGRIVSSESQTNAFYKVTSQDFSQQIDVYVDSTDSGNLNHQFVSAGNNNSSGFSIDTTQSALQLDFITSQSGAAQQTRATNQLIAGRLNRMLVTRSGSSAKIYYDGREVSYEVVGVHVDPVATTLEYTLGLRIGNGIDRSLFYRDRALSAADALWLTIEPYAFLRPIMRRRYFILPPPPFLRGTLYDDAFDLVPLYAGR